MVKGQIVYFVVNASPKLLDVATSFAGAQGIWKVLGNILCNHDLKVKSGEAGW